MAKKISPETSDPPSLRVLIVEDSEDDALLIIRQLKKGGYNPVYERVETEKDMSKALREKHWDIILCDYKMPHFSGPAAIALLKETNIDIPLIIVSGTIGEETAVACMLSGANDYIMKDRLSRLIPAMEREIAEAKSRAERKLAEQAVIASEVRFRELFENMSSCIAVYEALADGSDFVLKDFNRAAEIAEKIDRQKIIGQSLLQVFPGVRDMGLLEMLQRVWRTGQAEHLPATYYKDKRVEGWRENYVYKLPTGEVVALYSDITSRKQVEAALHKTQKQLQDAYHLAEIGSWSWNLNDKTITWSEELCNIVGLKSQQLTYPDTKHPLVYTGESWELLKKTFADCLKTGNPIQVELEIVHPDGNNRWLNWIGGLIYDDSGKITGLHGTAQNITQRKMAESQREAALEELRESEEKYRWVFDNMADVITVIDMDLRFTYVSSSIMRQRGYTVEEAKAQTMEQVMTPESLQIIAQVFAEEMNLEASGTADPARSRILEVEEYKKDGSIIWIENHLSFLRDETKKAVGIISLARDISELKRAEAAQKQSENRYRSLFENAQEGIYRSTPVGRIVVANQAMANMLGYKTPEDLITSVTDMSHQLYINPAERAKIEKIIAEQGSVRNYETQFYRKDGSIIWVSLTMHSDRDAKGQIIHYDCMNEDITKQKQVVEQIRKALGATVQAITVTVETRDPYTAGHQRKVSDLARAIATEMNIPADQIEGIRMAAAIHDLGKISVPAEILSKPTKLTNIEFSLIKNHPQSGRDILKDIDFPWPVARIVLEHHERMNGSGYPQGLIGDNILLESRILAVADVVESMSSHRPYRPALGIEPALEEIEKNKGTFYDSNVVEACLRLFREKGFQLG
jgi:PAS domain S-box-containing protein